MAELKTRVVMDLVDRITKPVRRITNAFKRFTRDARVRALSDGFKEVGQRFSEVRRQTGLLTRRFAIMAAAASGAALAVFGLASNTARVGDQVGKTARKLGIGVQELQAYRFAFDRLAGVTQQTTDMALQRFTRRVAEAASGTGEAQGALKFLGIELKDTEGRLRGPAKLLPEVADALAKVEDQSLRVRLAFKLFDSEGVALVNGLQEGSKALLEQMELAKRLGLLTEEQTRQSEAYNDSLGNFLTVIRYVRDSVVQQFLPGLTRWLDINRELTVANREVIVKETVRRIREFTGRVRDIGSTINTVVNWIGGWKVALTIIASLMATKVVFAVGGLIKQLWLLVPAIAKATKFIWGLSAAMLANPIGIMAAAIVSLIGVVALLRTEWVRSSRVWLEVSNTIGGTIEQIVLNFSLMRDKAIGSIKTMVSAATNLVPDWLRRLFSGAVNIGGAIGTRVQGFFSQGGRENQSSPVANQPMIFPKTARTEIGGLLRIQIDSEGRARVKQFERRGPLDIDIDAGLLGAGIG